MAECKNGACRDERCVVGHLVEAFDDDIKAVSACFSKDMAQHSRVIEREGSQPFDADTGHPVLMLSAFEAGSPVSDFKSAGGESPEDFIDVRFGPPRFGVVGIALIQD